MIKLADVMDGRGQSIGSQIRQQNWRAIQRGEGHLANLAIRAKHGFPCCPLNRQPTRVDLVCWQRQRDALARITLVAFGPSWASIAF